MLRKPHPNRKDVAASISGVDQKIRECLQVLWLSLPREQANWDSLERNFQRLVDRALRDFHEDLQHFPDKNDDVF